MDIVLKMPKTEADSAEGINDSGIETYKNMPIASLTKEELQNSTDGAERVDGHAKKVIVEFNDFYIKKENYPDFVNTFRVFQEERKFWDNFLKNDKKAVRFFDNAIEILKEDSIRCLRISDFNTTGLTGIDGKSTPWKNLVKNSGVSDKPGYCGGSFGIGKNAAFACSQLRTVFYNTKNIDSESAFQGVLKLPSYEDGESNYTGVGYYSDPSDNKTNPLRKSYSLDDSYERTCIGMDKYILGFDKNYNKDQLKNDIIVSSVNNFLYAFIEDILEVKYGDIKVNSNNINDIINQYKEKLEVLTLEYYQTLLNPQRIEYATVFNENDVKIFVSLNPEGSRKAAVVRQSGMKVFDKGNISGRIGFSAVIVLVGNEVNEYFKKLENAEHTQWSEYRSEDANIVKKNQEKIFGKLREIIAEMHKEECEDIIDADGLNEYLPFSYVVGKNKVIEGLSVEVENKSKAKKKKKSPKNKIEQSDFVNYEIDENGNIIEDTIHIGKMNGPDPEPNPNPYPYDEHDIDANGDGDDTFSISKDSTKFKSKRKINTSSIRFSLSKADNKYRLKFISQEKLKAGFFDIQISGEQDSYPTEVLLAEMNGKELDIKGNKIAFDNINAGQLYEIEFELGLKGEWALEVTTNESER